MPLSWARLSSCPHMFGHLQAICFQVTSASVSRPASLPITLGVPPEGLSRDVGGYITQGLAYPPPSTLLDINSHQLLFVHSHSPSYEETQVCEIFVMDLKFLLKLSNIFAFFLRYFNRYLFLRFLTLNLNWQQALHLKSAITGS